MSVQAEMARGMDRTLALYPWFKFFQSLLFWQAVWFLYFQQTLSPAAAIALYAVYDISVTLLEVPLGVLSDRIGRRRTLILSGLAGLAGSVFLATGDSLAIFVVGQFFLGAGSAFASGTDSAMLFESLTARNRAGDVEAEETRALRFSLWGFAISAALGGALALWSYPATFWAAGAALAVSTWIAFRMSEPPRHLQDTAPLSFGQAMREGLTQPVLQWIFALAVVMYGFSHLPFVFGQPFIAAALESAGLDGEAPVVSGGVSALMMGVSVLATFVALGLRQRIGLTRMLLLAFGLQIGLITVLATTASWLAIAILLLRMVPDSFSKPFMMGRIQPNLRDEVRATYVSMQSLAGKLVFSLSLFVAAGSASAVADMPHADIRMILGWYVAAGVVIWAVLAVTARRAGVEPATHQ